MKKDVVGYWGTHYRLRQVLPQVCAFLDGTCHGRLEVAFKHDTPASFIRHQDGLPYSVRGAVDYLRLCVSHHRRYDLAEVDVCKYGHPRTSENTYIRPNTGRPICLICKRASWRKWSPKRARVRSMTAVAFMIVFVTALSAQAAGITIVWTGQGSDNLPCDSGGHWVLTGHGITSATMTVNGSVYTMSQNGNGSFAADSVESLDTSITASVTYEGEANNPQFVLSHCTQGGSPPPSPSPSVSPTPTGSPSPSGTPTFSAHTSTSGCVKIAVACSRAANHDPSPSIQTTATTGLPKLPLVLGSILLSLGFGATIVARRRSA